MSAPPDLWRRVRPLLASLSPGRRKWKAFLRSLPLDPETLSQPLAAPGDRDVIICGVPRSGTTLLCAMLFQPPHAITVMEPWDGMRLAPEALFRSLRQEIESGTLSRGKLDVRALQEERAVRWRGEEDRAVDVPPLDPNYVLAVKWPAYWRYVELLPSTRFLVCVRDPFEVIASFIKEGGRLSEGLMYDTAFNQSLHHELLTATDDEAERRVRLYSMITSRLLPHLDRPNVFVVRYERWATEPDKMMKELSDFLATPLPEHPVDLRPPGPPRSLNGRDRDLIRAYGSVAESLGYSLSSSHEPNSSTL